MSRQLDIAIAKLFNIKQETMVCEGAMIETVRVPQYSSDGNAMLKLDQLIKNKGYDYFNLGYGQHCKKFYAEYGIHAEPEFMQKYYYKKIGKGIAKTEPLARALAAYQALTGKEWEE